GWILTDGNPEFVVLGETRTYSFEAITTAINLIRRGARFIATNPDVTGPAPQGILPATGSVAALITAATNREPYYVGMPSPGRMPPALINIGVRSQQAVMIGDRMHTAVKAGLEAGMRPILVRTGTMTDELIARLPFRPSRVLDSVADLP